MSRAILTPLAAVGILLAAIALAVAFLSASSHLSKAGSETSSTSLYRGVSESDIMQILDRADQEVQLLIGSGALNYTDYSSAFLNISNRMLADYLHKKGIVDVQLVVVKGANITMAPSLTGIQPIMNYGEYTVVLRR